jgi:hypothetical protein
MDGRNFCKELIAINVLRSYEQYISKRIGGAAKQFPAHLKTQEFKVAAPDGT